MTMQLDSFTITLLLVLIITIISSFSRRKKRDKCLIDFKELPVTIERINGEIMAKGIMNVHNTGLELKYPKAIDRNSKFIESSYLIYKYEFDQIQSIIIYHDELSDVAKKKRDKILKQTYRPSFFRRTKRNIQNFFKIIKDSLNDLVNALAMQFQKSSAGAVFKTHEKLVKKINTELVESVGSEHDPLLESYIGQRVVFELIKGEKLYKYSGVLKKYTVSFIQLMDVMYKTEDDEKMKLVDILIPQKLGIVRHLGEVPHDKYYPLVNEIQYLSNKISSISLKKHKNDKENPVTD